MAKRKAIGKKLRFEVFKRDGFKCQYCGKSAPTVVLHVDHITPVANGGDADIMNLITSCEPCNLGKGARTLSDDSVIQKQKKQLAVLNEKREQLEMMLKWREGLNELGNMQVSEVGSIFGRCTGRRLTEYGTQQVKRWIKKYSLEEVLESVDISIAQYLEYESEGRATQDSANKAFDYIPRICAVRLASKQKPYLPDLFKLKWLAKKQLYNAKEWEIMRVLEEAYLAEVDIPQLREIINCGGTWRQFKDDLEMITGVYHG